MSDVEYRVADEAAPVMSLYFGAQPGREAFYEALGFEPGLPSYSRRKRRG